MNEYCNDLNNFSAQKMPNYLSDVSLSVMGLGWVSPSALLAMECAFSNPD